MTQNCESIIFRVTGRKAEDRVLWASDTARKITYFNPAGKHLSDVFSGYFCAENPDLRSGSFVNVDGNNFIANIMNIGMDDCFVINLFPLAGDFDVSSTSDLSPDEELNKKTLALRLAVCDLELNRKKLRNSNEIAGMGSFEYISDQHCLVLTPEACHVLGLDDKKTVVSSDEICSRVKNGKLSGMCEAIMSSNMKAQFETEIIIVNDDGTERFVRVVMNRLTPDENILDGVFMDVTYIKNAENELRRQDAYYRAMFEKANIGIFTIHKNGMILSCNPYIENLSGYSLAELSGTDCSKLMVYAGDRDKIQSIFRNVTDKMSNSSPSDFCLVKKDGTLVDVLISFEIIKLDDGDECIFGFLNNIDEYKQMQRTNIEQERMLLQQSKMATMGEMMGIIAHQWMQPLNSIAMISQMLQELVEVDPDTETLIRKTVSSILDQINFMTATANDFRSFLKPSEKPTEFSPVEAVKSVLTMYRPQLKYQEVKCGMFFDSEEAKKSMVYGYENEFKNVVMNLCTNARDALEQNNVEDAEIEIFFESHDDRISISVCDNGGGIPQHILEKIFCAYVTSKGEKGTGLGLYMSKLIIKERMNGDITAYNNENGAVIKITLDDVSKKHTLD